MYPCNVSRVVGLLRVCFTHDCLKETGVVTGGSGVIHVPSLIKFFGKVNEAGHGGWCKVDPEDLGMKRGRDILEEGIHFGCLICLGA